MNDRPSRSFVERCRRNMHQGKTCIKQPGGVPASMFGPDTKWCKGCDKPGKDRR